MTMWNSTISFDGDYRKTVLDRQISESHFHLVNFGGVIRNRFSVVDFDDDRLWFVVSFVLHFFFIRTMLDDCILIAAIVQAIAFAFSRTDNKATITEVAEAVHENGET